MEEELIEKINSVYSVECFPKVIIMNKDKFILFAAKLNNRIGNFYIDPFDDKLPINYMGIPLIRSKLCDHLEVY